MSDIERKILELCGEPTEREKIERSLEYPEEDVKSTLRELLYSGKLETTPDWKYELPNANTDQLEGDT